MIATLKGSVGKMNDLLARLGPTADQRPARLEPWHCVRWSPLRLRKNAHATM